MVQAGFGESFKKFSDSLSFEKWAPRSSRAWRLGIDIHKEKAESGAAACHPSSVMLMLSED